MKKQIPAWLVLAVIMVVAAVALAGTNMVTKDIIDGQAIKAKEAARKAVLETAETFEKVELEQGAKLDSLFVGKKGDEVVGYVGVITVKGYGGPIELTTGLTQDGTITGLNVGGAAFAETPGLGAKAKDAAFMAQFAGKKSPLKVIKQGETAGDHTVDALTAATITSSAVARGANDVAKFVAAAFSQPAAGGEGVFTPGTAKASQDGFGGPVAVEVTFDENKAITAIKIGDENFAETPGFGAAALEDGFQQMLIGKKAPLTINDIDAISGATITSEAVVEAINKAYNSLISGGAAAFTAGDATASADGFGGPVAVALTFDENGVITAAKVGDENFAETPGFGAAALEDSFQQMLIGKKAPLTINDIDAISGATITSEAVVEAINKAYQSRMTGGAAAFTAGDATASADGFGGPVAVALTFDENGVITAAKVGDENFAETPGFGAAALEDSFQQMLIGKKAPLTINDIDAISGATVTSEAVVEAINKAYQSRMTGGAGQAAAEPAKEETKEVKEEVKAEPAAEASAQEEGGVTVSKDGFAGPVAVTVWMEVDGKTIRQVKIGDDKFAETPSFGAGALEESFMAQFAGKTVPLTLDGIDAISGATVTSQAVVDAINEAAGGAAAVETTAEPAAEASAQEEGGVTVSKDGFAGPVAVTVWMEADGKTIRQVKIGDDKFAETPGFGAGALEESFTAQFAGKTVPLTLDGIDAISGATVTSQAVVDAINEAAGGAAAVETTAESAAPAADGGLKASKMGFRGPVAVTVWLKEDGKTIDKVLIGDKDFMESEGRGAKALEESFMAQFAGKTVPLTVQDIDAIAGATFTTRAVVDAVNQAAQH